MVRAMKREIDHALRLFPGSDGHQGGDLAPVLFSWSIGWHAWGSYTADLRVCREADQVDAMFVDVSGAGQTPEAAILDAVARAEAAIFPAPLFDGAAG